MTSKEKWISDQHVGQPCLLNGKPATVVGRRTKLATIVPSDKCLNSIQVEWSVVDEVMKTEERDFTTGQ